MDDQIGIKILFILDLSQVRNYSKEFQRFGCILNQELCVLIRNNTPVTPGNPDRREKIKITGILSDKKVLPEFECKCMDVLRNIPCITNISIASCSVFDVFLFLISGKYYG